MKTNNPPSKAVDVIKLGGFRMEKLMERRAIIDVHLLVTNSAQPAQPVRLAREGHDDGYL
jgi:hypothetical protein